MLAGVNRSRRQADTWQLVRGRRSCARAHLRALRYTGIGWGGAQLARWCGEGNAPLDAAGGQTSRLARVEEEGQAAGPRGTPICPLIGPCGRMDPAWMAELEFGLFL